MKKINIAIDGPSASGKGVTAKKLAKLLTYNYLDTGSMYRAIGYYMYKNKITFDDFNNYININKKDILKKIKIDFNDKNNILLNGVDIENKIRTAEISMYASNFSKLKEIREFLVKKQKEIVKNKGYIADGRDIGSVVIPDAEVKIYLTAKVGVRAIRRYKEYLDKGVKTELKEVMNDMKKRDEQDMNRKESPLIKVDDAIEVDTTNLTIEEQVEKILKIIKTREIVNIK